MKTTASYCVILFFLSVVASQSAISDDNWSDGGGEVKWQLACDFLGSHHIERIPSTGEICGDLCIASVNCTHFRYVPDGPQAKNGNCHLKVAPLSSRATVVPGGMCGFVPWKFEPGRDHWSGDKSVVKWLRFCDFHGHDIGRERSVPNDCGAICLANPECSHFRHVDGFCYVKKAPLSTQRIVVNGGVCGYISSREFEPIIHSHITEDVCECVCE